MRWVVPLLLIGCGGGSTPPPQEPTSVEPKRVTRVPIENDSDDEPEDGVTFTKTRGSISAEAIQAALAPHNQEMMDCYTQNVGKRRWLGGHVVLHWDLKADGTVASVKMAESNLGAWPVEKCLLDIAWSATFEKPKGGDADFTLPLDFQPPSGTKIWDEDMALRAVGGQLAALDDCDDFEPGKPGKKPRKAPKPAKNPNVDKPARPERPPSNVTITLYVGPQGKTQSIGFSSSTSEVGEKWAACAEQTAQTWRLPDPRGQIAKLAVRYRAE
ncbi:MAG: AgmX/PglI C-terminal domain-containing protein [Kofleriaceae bacterium]|nr:AgmX/PglI C-terminal domain-containing protein [Kofleriaceae bacterium]